VPTPAQLPADAHEIELSVTEAGARAFAGAVASIPIDQVPAVSVKSNPCPVFVLSS
jgi:hypothetical protein